MVLLRTQERKNYDIKKISNTIFAREMKEKKRRSRERKKQERRRKARERRHLKQHERHFKKYLRKFFRNPDNIDGVFLKLKDIEDIVIRREENTQHSMYKSRYDTFENKLKRLNKELDKKIHLNEEISPSDYSPADIVRIIKWCKQFSDNEKYLSEICSFGRFRGPQSCDQHRNIVSMHFENTMRAAIESGNDYRVKRLLDIIERYNATNAVSEFDLFNMEADTFSKFAESYKYLLKSHAFKSKKKRDRERLQWKKDIDIESKEEQRKIDAQKRREKRVKERRNKKLLEKGILPPVESTGDVSVDRQNRINRRQEQKLLLEQPVVQEKEVAVQWKTDIGYISSDTDDDEWGTYKEKVNEFSDCDSEEEFDAGF